ncbi:MAG: biotin/lipoyl-binding protein, partial [Halanaerobium sp.]|nr:biotin/lipoyl-binding protein [Halanaerobium sp.]
MKKLIIILLILAAALGGLYYQFRSEYLISKKEAAFIGVREKVDTVTAVPGTVQSRQDVKIRAELAGRVAKLYVAEEDDVEKGDPLIKVDDSSVQENLADLRLALAVAENNYQSLQKKYENQEEQTELQLANARRDLEIARTSYAMEAAAL